MTKDQEKEAIALLRAIHADIEAMRHSDGFGVFDGTVGDFGFTGGVIEWPNLSILSVMIGKYLNKYSKRKSSPDDSPPGWVTGETP